MTEPKDPMPTLSHGRAHEYSGDHPIRIAPSLIPAADLANIASEVKRVEAAVDLLHIDVMDGHFVPNLTVGPPVIGCMRKHTTLYFDCHLMMSNPGEYLEAFKNAGANGCTVHWEAGETLSHISHMRDLQLDVGLAINPATPCEEIEDYLPLIDMVTVMTVVPGFGGQAFMEDVLPKMRAIRDIIRDRKLHVVLEVDGGISAATAPKAVAAGADTLVAGNAIFGAADPVEAGAAIREAVRVIRRF